jgi:UDP-4-amino-4,6-dideoxy-N-acetyl-beta-L-altrosamine N-acetyltransferase
MSDICTIRPVVFSDLPTVLVWRNHLSIRQFMFTQHEISLAEHTAWFQKFSQDETRYLMMVEEKKKPIGCVQFSKVAIDGVGDWGFYVVPNSPKGTGRKLGVTALSYAFDVLRLHKVCGQAIELNTASIGFHQALGFKQEGVLREQQHIDDVHHNIICFGLIAREWALIKPYLDSKT